VNDRVDVALAAGAFGVQLPGRGIPTADVRGMVPPGFRIGASVRAVEATPPDADWLIAGNVYETASHPGMPASGPNLITGLAGRGVPVIAVGGITPERVAEMKSAGAAGVAVIRGVWDDPDPAAAVLRYLNAWEQG
jgi:thiazole tautomerase (transcriptional regulator TenI)